MGTVVWWAPLMMKIGETPGEFPLGLFRLLLTTHWLRVALITAYGVLAFWMVLVSIHEQAGETARLLTAAQRDSD